MKHVLLGLAAADGIEVISEGKQQRHRHLEVALECQQKGKNTVTKQADVQLELTKTNNNCNAAGSREQTRNVGT